MPELPRLKQMAPLQGTGPSPEAASLVSRSTAAAAGQAESAFGSIVNKATELERIEYNLKQRYAADEASFNHFNLFMGTADAIRNGDLTYEQIGDSSFAGKTGPVQTEDLMRAYNVVGERIRKQGLDSLTGWGPLAQYAFSNEFDSRATQHLEKLHMDRDRRMHGDLMMGLDKFAKQRIQDAANGPEAAQKALGEYENELNTRGVKFMSAEQRQAHYDKTAKDILLSPYRARIAAGESPKILEELETHKVDLPSDLLAPLRQEVLRDNWEVSSAASAKDAADRRKFELKSEANVKQAMEDVKSNNFTRVNLAAISPQLTRGDYEHLDAALTATEIGGGGYGNPVSTAKAKLDIAMDPAPWNPARIKSFIKANGLNSEQGLALVNELFKAETQRRNAENDPNHFSKDHRFKLYHNGLNDDLGVPLSLVDSVDPSTKALLQQAKYDFYNEFQIAYDSEGKIPMPDPEVVRGRIVNRYADKIKRVAASLTPYNDIQGAITDLEARRITPVRFAEIGWALAVQANIEKNQAEKTTKKKEWGGIPALQGKKEGQ